MNSLSMKRKKLCPFFQEREDKCQFFPISEKNFVPFLEENVDNYPSLFLNEETQNTKERMYGRTRELKNGRTKEGEKERKYRRTK